MRALRISVRLLLSLFFLSLSSSCIQDPNIQPSTPTPFPTATATPSATPSSYVITPAVRINYGSASERQHYDFYTAVGDAASRPVILYVHGGAWVFGPQPANYDSFIKSTVDYPSKNLTQTLINNGYAVAIMKYREPKYYKKTTVVADVPYASSALANIMNDIDSAMGSLVSNAGTFKIDVNRMALLGDSAGAHLVTTYSYGTTPNQSRVKTVVAFYGPYDLSKPDVTPNLYSYPYNGHNPALFVNNAASSFYGNSASEDEDTSAATISVYLMRVFDSLTGTFIASQESAVRRTFSPVGLIDARGGPSNVPMTFALHGARDNLVNPNQLNYFKAALGAQDYTDALADNKNASRHLTSMLTGFDHGFVAVNTPISGLPAKFDQQISPKVVRWFNARLK